MAGSADNGESAFKHLTTSPWKGQGDVDDIIRTTAKRAIERDRLSGRILSGDGVLTI